jgi:hypothetical protein
MPKGLPAETPVNKNTGRAAAELDALLTAILDRRWAKAEIATRLHPILARQETETRK